MPLLSKSPRIASDDTDTRAGNSSSLRADSTSSSNQNSNKRTGRSRFGLFGRRNKSRSIDRDPSIINARQKVADAEKAEKSADRALIGARQHVQLAREHVHKLEQEALEGSRMAKLKQAESKAINKTAKSLGRHGP